MSDILGSSPPTPTTDIFHAYHLHPLYSTPSFLTLLYFRRVRALLIQSFLICVLFAYFFMILVSGGIFLAVVLVPYAGYKIYKKYAPSCSINSLFFCCGRRAHAQGRGRDNYGNFLRKKTLPRVELDFPPELRVGETISLRVIFPLCRHRTLSIVQNPDTPHQPSLQESVRIQQDYNLDDLTVEIVKVSASTTSLPPPPPIRELLPRSTSTSAGSSTSTPDEDTLLVKFLVQESGFYQINIIYEGDHVPGSPFPTPFNPGALDPLKTSVCRKESPLILGISGESSSASTILIQPRDRYGNECNFGDVDPALFHFRLMQQGRKKGRTSGPEVEAVLYNFTREIKPRMTSLLGDVDVEECLQVRLDIEIFLPGVFQGVITYNGEVIGGGGGLEIVTLSPEENEALRNQMAGGGSVPGMRRYQEGKLLSIGGEVSKKPRPVCIFIAAKALTVKEYYFAGLIPFCLANFRILPATRVKLLSITSAAPGSSPGICIIEISDRSQSQSRLLLEMDESSGRLLLAIFALYLQLRLGGSESFENKQKFFYQELISSGGGRVDRTTGLVLNINRASIINSTLAETRNFSGKDWMRNFKIKFIGEEGSDDGGLRREWLNLICKEFFDDSGSEGGGMFSTMGNSRLVHPNGGRDQGKWGLKHYELAGRIVGKCLYETAVGGFYKQMVNSRFTRSFLGMVIGFSPHYKYFESDDPDLYVSKVKYLLENDVGPMELTFTEDEYNPATGQLVKTVELLSNGRNIAVLNENKEEYLNLLASYRLSTRVRKEVEAFVKGLGEIVPEGLLTNFDENELELLMCGKSHFSVSDLQSHHVLSGGGGAYDRVLPWFWTALSNMTDEERGRLLQFVTGSSLLPHGGFRELLPTFRITVYEDTLGKLPLAHTCFSEICLSLHRNYEEFEKALKTAVNEGSEGFALL